MSALDNEIKLEKNFINGFLNKELKFFAPIILFNMGKEKGQKWINDFKNLLKQILKNIEESIDTKELATQFREYEKTFYEIVIDEGLLKAFEATSDSELKKNCINTIKNIADTVLCLDEETYWDKSELSISMQLRTFFLPERTIISKRDCSGAGIDLWNYIQEISTVKRNDEKVKMQRLLTFKRTGSHQLLISMMTDAKTNRKCWLSRVIQRIVNELYPYAQEIKDVTTFVSIDEPIDLDSEECGNNEALDKEIADARSIAEQPFYIKKTYASHWAYYEALSRIMSKAQTKQYEVWLLRVGFPQMLMKQTKFGLDEPGLRINDTRAILTCLSHDEKWKKKRCKMDMNRTQVWGTPDVWKLSDSLFSGGNKKGHLINARESLSKMNSLFLNRLDGEIPGRNEEEKNYFARLLFVDSENTMDESSTAKIAVEFKNFLTDDEDRELPFMDILAQNITEDDEDLLDDFLESFARDSIVDVLYDYFKQPSIQSANEDSCIYCRGIADVPGLSDDAKMKLKIKDNHINN